MNHCCGFRLSLLVYFEVDNDYLSAVQSAFDSFCSTMLIWTFRLQKISQFFEMSSVELDFKLQVRFSVFIVYLKISKISLNFSCWSWSATVRDLHVTVLDLADIHRMFIRSAALRKVLLMWVWRCYLSSNIRHNQNSANVSSNKMKNSVLPYCL
jgi:hypothetical protein